MNVPNALRVLHILPSMQGYGAERQIMQLIPHLQSEDIVAGLLTIYASSEEQRCGVPFPVADASRNGRRDVTFVTRLVERIGAFAPDIVHTHTHVGKYWGRFAAAAAGVRAIVHTEHNPCDPRRSVLDRIADRVLNRYTTSCITFFEEQRDVLARTDALPAHRIEIIPNGLAFDGMPAAADSSKRRSLGLFDDEFVVILIGRMEYQKNHELALRALAALPVDMRARTILLFAGSGVLQPELIALADSLSIRNRVRFLGYRQDVAQLLSASDMLLMTSRFEGMPLALLEAMNAAVPIVTTPWTGSTSMLGGGSYGRIAAGWQAEDLAAEIAGVYNGRWAARIYAERASAYVRGAYTLSRMARAHRDLYRRLVRRKEQVA